MNGNHYNLKENSVYAKVSKTNLYIKGLPNNYTDDDILLLAPEVSSVRSVKAAIEDDGKCKGYGFIDFVTPDEASYGLTYIQEKCPNFTVKFAKENEKDKTNLYITNLPKTWTSKDSDKLKSLFEKYGEIQSAFIMLEKHGNKPLDSSILGVGFVRFFNEESAQFAISDLEGNPKIVNEECDAPLEAKFADKHNTDTRRKNPTLKSGINGKIQSSNHLPLLTSSNGMPILTGFDSYMKRPFVSNVPSTNNSDVYSQYLWNIASNCGYLDPYFVLPTLIAPASNYLSAFNGNTSNATNYYSNMFYSVSPNVQNSANVSNGGVPLNCSYFIPNTGQSPPANDSFLTINQTPVLNFNSSA